MKIYISIPISGQDEEKQRQRADLIQAALSRAGHEVVNPFLVYAGKNASYAEHICYDLLALSGCDAIFLCNGWQFSRGCRIERNFAEEFNIQIMTEK